MSARGVKTMATDNDGSDHAYRQTIENKYQLRAQLKATVKLALHAIKGYFAVALAVTLVQCLLDHYQSPLLKHHPLPLGLSPLPLLSLLVVAGLVTWQSLTAIQVSSFSVMLHVSSLLCLMTAVIAVGLPLSRHTAGGGLTTIDWLVLAMHTAGLSSCAYGLYNGYRLAQISTRTPK